MEGEVEVGDLIARGDVEAKNSSEAAESLTEQAKTESEGQTEAEVADEERFEKLDEEESEQVEGQQKPESEEPDYAEPEPPNYARDALFGLGVMLTCATVYWFSEAEEKTKTGPTPASSEASTIALKAALTVAPSGGTVEEQDWWANRQAGLANERVEEEAAGDATPKDLPMPSREEPATTGGAASLDAGKGVGPSSQGKSSEIGGARDSDYPYYDDEVKRLNEQHSQRMGVYDKLSKIREKSHLALTEKLAALNAQRAEEINRQKERKESWNAAWNKFSSLWTRLLPANWRLTISVDIFRWTRIFKNTIFNVCRHSMNRFKGNK